LKTNADLLLRISREIACKIFEVLWQNFKRNPKNIDRIAEGVAIRLLEEKGYAANVFSEESGHFRTAKKPQFTLTLDPLDGSHNYIAGIPIFAVSVAASRKACASKLSDVDAAVIKTSFGKEYTAKKGQRLQVKEGQRASEKNCRLMRVPYIDRIPFRPVHYRMFGASALELCLLAEGSLTIFVDEGTLKATDIAGALLIVQESGGKITDLQGNDSGNFSLHSRHLSLLAARTPQIHSRVLKLFQESH
jgi:fructose-1,6-bisphosphatase/inositol monophosphatase family enzyme